MASARDRTHLGHCGEVGHCLYVGGPGGEQCDALDSALSQVEDDRAHKEAERLRLRADAVRLGMKPSDEAVRTLILGLADMIDPYETRDGRLFRKSDGCHVPV